MNTGRRVFLLGLTVALLPWRVTRAAAKARVIVIGGGFGGATCARYLCVLSPGTDVLLIEPRSSFFTGPFTNLVIAGLRTPQSITRDVAAIGKAQRFQLVHAEVSALDPVNLSVTTSGQTFHADKVVVSPGISMRWGVIEGLDATRSALMPHAWLGDSQVLTLRDRLKAVPDGGTILIAAPPNPYRCPPGPYERATLFAHVLKRTGRSRTKILIADAKDDFSKSALFKLEWDALYPGMIEWMPRQSGGEVIRVDTATGEVWQRGSATPARTTLASIIPAQRAAELAVRADLVDESGWCPIKPDTFESTRHPGVHVIGDACAAAPMPKSAFAANSQAKLCASAIAAMLEGLAAPEARLLNTCYSWVSDHEAISVSGYYGGVGGKLSALSEGMSPLAGDAALRHREGRQANAWYDGITTDSFGRR